MIMPFIENLVAHIYPFYVVHSEGHTHMPPESCSLYDNAVEKEKKLHIDILWGQVIVETTICRPAAGFLVIIANSRENTHKVPFWSSGHNSRILSQTSHRFTPTLYQTFVFSF